MARSLKKGPYVEQALQTKIEKMNLFLRILYLLKLLVVNQY